MRLSCLLINLSSIVLISLFLITQGIKLFKSHVERPCMCVHERGAPSFNLLYHKHSYIIYSLGSKPLILTDDKTFITLMQPWIVFPRRYLPYTCIFQKDKRSGSKYNVLAYRHLLSQPVDVTECLIMAV